MRGFPGACRGACTGRSRLAICLLIASAPFDIAISSVIWNPPVAAALIKMATAIALMIQPPSLGSRAAASASRRRSRWMAVQAHLVGALRRRAVARRARAATSVEAVRLRARSSAVQRRRAMRDAGRSLAIVAAIVLPADALLIALFTEPARRRAGVVGRGADEPPGIQALGGLRHRDRHHRQSGAGRTGYVQPCDPHVVVAR